MNREGSLPCSQGPKIHKLRIRIYLSSLLLNRAEVAQSV